MDITTIGFDLAKTVFQVHGADAKGRPVLRRKLRRGKVLAFFAELPSCLVGMRPVPLRTIGLGSCRHSGTKCG